MAKTRKTASDDQPRPDKKFRHYGIPWSLRSQWVGDPLGVTMDGLPWWRQLWIRARFATVGEVAFENEGWRL